MATPRINKDLYAGDTGKQLKDIKTNADNITSIISVLNPIGSIIGSGNEQTFTATQGQSNNVGSLNVPAGTWLVLGKWRYEGNDVSSYTTFERVSVAFPDSVYDSLGWVNKAVFALVQSNNPTTVWLNLWPRNKTISVKTQIWAIRIK